ncbi:ABC transporter substrate-binding protein [Roseomonas sp. PWR1]|uniref:ABC transporter substrate-binding protein n=1 Tax=Roseomonas nitratireducens TaxID=2820810 RepID=A0ABS4AVN3_9PROT|nr:ABC transporter substrate-binding protein [Neoroseomonas nitratireducens]MBP0465415.1 ABC transporter substrate-binding protein [Neoroseomonas nitratireducens]
MTNDLFARLGRRTVLGTALAGLAAPPSLRAQAPALKIGVLSDMSSVYADYAGVGSVEAARMAIADSGLGERVQLVSADHQNRPDVGSNTARSWYDTQGVDAIFDCPTSSVALAVNTVAGQAKKLCIFSTAIIDRLTEEDCNGYGLSWTWDIYSVARSSALLQMRRGLDTWFIIHQDYAAGHALAAAARDTLQGAGGRVVGSVAHPLGTTDFAAYLLQAQASRAKFVMFTAGGTDLINALKQVREFGLVQRGQQIGTMFTVITDVHAIGLDALQGLNFVTAFYWDRDEQTRAFARRFFATRQKQPTMFQAGVYSAVSQYLNAVKATGSTKAEDVRGYMRDRPFEDFFARNARLLPNGRLIHDMLTARIKAPSEQRHPWDYYEIVGVVPATEAFRTIEQSKCRMQF